MSSPNSEEQHDEPLPRESAAAQTSPPLHAPTTPFDSHLAIAQKNTVSFQNDSRPEPLLMTFGRYQILEECPGGGMGVVYRARDTVLGREVALKTIRSKEQADTDLGERFYREAQAVAQLQHPNIIKIFDYGEIQGRHYFTMSLIRHGSLDNHLARFHDNRRAAVILMQKVAQAVQYIHEHGLLHRDLKPGNILLDEHDEPLVSDFGLAKPTDSDPGLTAPGHAPGTPAYMAPEQASGDTAAVGKQTDVWALGVILYELLTGKRPFAGPGSDRVKQAILTTDPLPLRSLNKHLERDLETIVLKCLEKDPARRYISAGALADDLGCWLRGEPIHARPPTFLRKVVLRIRRHPLLTTSIVSVALLAIAVHQVILFFDPDQIVYREMYPSLRSGEKLVLIGPTGGPKWSKWRVSGRALESSPEGNFGIEALKPCLMELLPDPQTESYRLRAEVRHEETEKGFVGIYLCHTSQLLGKDELHFFSLVRFADIGKNADIFGPGRSSGQVQLLLVDYSRTDEKGLFDRLAPAPRVGNRFLPGIHKPFESVQEKRNRRPKDVRTLAPVWRQLRIDVTPEHLQVYWEQQEELLGTLPVADLVEQGRYLLFHRPQIRGANPRFPLRGGIGLFAYEGAASFRNIIVEPLQEKKR